MSERPHDTDLAGRARREDGGPYFIAEIGANHDGDVATAHQMIDLFADAGADAVKFQTYTSAILVSDLDRIYRYEQADGPWEEAVGPMFDRLALAREAHQELFDHARERGVEPFTTLFDPGDVAFALRLGQRLFKVSSGDVNYRQLLEAIAATGRPTIISGGKCTIGEYDRAIETLETGGGEVILLHCVASYPAPADDANLRILETLHRQYPDHLLGFSDHTEGITCVLGAIALNARVIEKHVTYDKKARGPDHRFSADPEEFAAMVTEGRRLERALGSSRKRVLASETYGMSYGRRSIVTRVDLAPGDVVRLDHLAFLRPGTGIDPFEIERVVGRTCRRPVSARTPLTWETFQEPEGAR